MNILTETTHNLADAFMHYVCIRMQFRSTVLKETGTCNKPDKRFDEFCPTKH